MNHSQTQFWSVPSLELLQQLQTTPQGLTSHEVQQRLLRYGSNLLKPKKKSDALTLLLAQFKSPIILILIVAAGLSFFLRNPMDATIILVIVLVSGFLGYWQERGAAWFLESVISASVTVLVIRTRKSFFRSKPGKYLVIITLLIVVVTTIFPFTPLAELLGFQPLPVTILLVISMIVGFYMIAAEITKRPFTKG